MKGPPETLDKEVDVDGQRGAEEYVYDGPPVQNGNDVNGISHAGNSVHDEHGEDLELEDAHRDVNASDLLANYSWMADADLVDQEILAEIEQEDYIEQCFEEMWREEAQVIASSSLGGTDAPVDGLVLERTFNQLAVDDSSILVPQVHLNPNAAEFVSRSSIDSKRHT